MERSIACPACDAGPGHKLRAGMVRPGRDRIGTGNVKDRRFYPFNAFRSLLGIGGDVEAPTYAELYSGDWIHPTTAASGHGR